MQLDPKFLLAVAAAIFFFFKWRQALAMGKKQAKKIAEKAAIQIDIRTKNLNIIAEKQKQDTQQPEA